ncbi:benzyl alcohol O-benzoyltransferase-like [Oryza brachyantha]|uniref:benzyl alcohol O-benzoyltransferase-like n=1 Tax=Oryza brachyantha TaxID=4533 RepID=UPI001ADD510C|nr:benzyl alcohol O-benzoyltransferase-like [Oryza brachyantha]
MAASSTTVDFTARRRHPELVAPAGPTPRGLRRLSDIDDQDSFRFYRSVIYFYRSGGGGGGVDPARVIRDALAAALVHYYPIAGRIRELPGRKLVVDCTGEGVSFVEADADVALEEFGDVLCPPIPCAGELLSLPESNSAVVTNRPLLYVQVTRLKCGGFVFGTQICHNLVDAAGITQFLQAVGELAKGMAVPSVRPVWARELFDARDPPRPAFDHPEYEPASDVGNDRLRPGDELVHRRFLFGPGDIAALRHQLSPPARLRTPCSRFLLLSAFTWRCRTAALGYAPGDEVRFMFVVNVRGRRTPPLPEGFYGNALTFGVARTTAGELCSGTLSRAVELVAAARARAMDDGYAQSVADTLVLRGRPRFTTARTYLVTDLTKSRLHEVDLGWGKPLFGGPATTTLATFHMPAGGGAIAVPMCLPPRAMERFAAAVRAGLAAETVVLSKM